ncbi:MAG: addiction module protein [Gammaproteobacteria bacterium]
MPSLEKLRLAELLLADLDTPNPEIDAIWREEAQKRWQVYKAGELETVSSANGSCIALDRRSRRDSTSCIHAVV